MKWGTIDHPKMAELAAYLGVHHLLAVGIVEAMCHWTSKYVPTGGIGKFSNAAIAAGMKWSGDPEALIAALVKARWVDAVSEAHRLFVHDWPEHCEKHTHERVKAMGVTFDDGTPPFSRKPGPKQKLQRSSGDRREIVDNSTPALPSHALPEPCLKTPQPPADAGGTESGEDQRRQPRGKSAPATTETAESPQETPRGALAPSRRRREPEPPPVPASLDTPEFRRAWAAYEAHRRANGWKTLKPASVAGQYERMAPWGVDAAVRRLRDSIANGWQGVFEPKGTGPPGSNAAVPRGIQARQAQEAREL